MKFSSSAAAMKGSVYSRFAERAASYDGTVAPLHIGDTWMAPADSVQVDRVHEADHPGCHRYTPVRGWPALVSAIASRYSDEVVQYSERQVLVTAGGTGGLAAWIGASVEPGDEVVILAPYWPLIAGMVRAFGGVPVELPFFETVDSPESAAAALQGVICDRTVAVYWNSPNNPTGRLLPQAWLEALVEVARAADLWIIADEVYESYVYEGHHVPTRHAAPERTISLHSFSKAYGLTGNRVGFLLGPVDAIEHARRIATHTYYSAPTVGQISALRALGPDGDAWVERARREYAAMGRWAADRLDVRTPEGSTFLFVPVSRPLDEVLGEAAERGVLLAAGTTFGPYPSHVRVCYTSARPDVVKAGIERVRDILR